MSDYPAGRDAVLYAIVLQIARAEHKFGHQGTPIYDRDWLLAAYAVARECLDGKAERKGPAFSQEALNTI